MDTTGKDAIRIVELLSEIRDEARAFEAGVRSVSAVADSELGQGHW